MQPYASLRDGSRHIGLTASSFILMLVLLMAGCSGPDRDATVATPQTSIPDATLDAGGASDGGGATSTTSSTVQPARSATLHVDAAAEAGGDGSERKPFHRLDDGLRALRAGETLVVHEGVYREQIKLEDPAAGTADQPISVIAAEGERVVLEGLLNLSGLKHWTVSGINVTWDPERNENDEHMVSIGDGSDWTFENAELWDAQSFSALLIAGNPSNWRVRNLHVHDTHPANDRNQDHLIYCNCGNGGGVIERNLLVGSPNGRGIKVGTVSDRDDPIANVTIRNNTIVDNKGPSNIQLSYRVSDVVIENNLLVGPAADRPNVTTYRLSGSNNTVRNNLGWDSTEVLQADALDDGGGNVSFDPRLDSSFLPADERARSFGHTAP